MHEHYIKWYSRHLSRDFEMLVYGHSGYPVVMFPTSQGRYYEYKDFKLVEALSPLIDSGRIKVYCPDSIDSQSWYNKSIHPADRVKTHNGYENLIRFDVLDLARRETGFGRVALAGCSFGAYHAMNLAFRHPDAAGYVFSLSGSSDIKQFLDGYYDDNCYFNNPPDYLPGLNNDSGLLDRIRRIGIILNAGEHDPCLGDTMRISSILNQKGIKHWLDISNGFGHDWPWWRDLFPKYLSQITEVQHA